MPFISLFSSSLCLGTILALSSPYWLFIWLGLELNLMSFVPLLSSNTPPSTSPAAMKYFLAQALGSGLLLLGAFLSLPNFYLTTPLNVMTLPLLLGILIKLGLPPCHFWFPSVAAMISWPMCTLLITWQKLAPLLILCFILTPKLHFTTILIIMLSAFLGGIGGLVQTQLRPLLAYSSIGHLSWMLSASMVSKTICSLYLLTYIMISLPLMLLLWISTSIHSMMTPLTITSSSPYMFILLLSLSGFPPFLGFFPKWLVIESLALISIPIILIILAGALINLYYYLNLSFLCLLSPYSPPLFQTPTPSLFIPISLFSTLTLGIAPITFLIL
uniref:NADH-ubiquinone oxidoreductase chain 2 n=1 Tax=Pelagomacellicephala iliffei TaxID=1960706 RepID=A0A8E7IWU7_9ANNE|nr:NADH dehydrogenase subunit 2 [Pelagomacellicephala iliffei]